MIEVFYEKLKAHHSSSLSDAIQTTSIPYNELGRDLVGKDTLVIVLFIIKMNILKDKNSKSQQELRSSIFNWSLSLSAWWWSSNLDNNHLNPFKDKWMIDDWWNAGATCCNSCRRLHWQPHVLFAKDTWNKISLGGLYLHLHLGHHFESLHVCQGHLKWDIVISWSVIILLLFNHHLHTYNKYPQCHLHWDHHLESIHVCQAQLKW